LRPILHRVPEPDLLSSPLAPEVSERLWKITIHNFPALPFNPELDHTGYEVVALCAPRGEFQNQRPVSLPNFVHPAQAIYIIGPDSRNMHPEEIPESLQLLRTHFVSIPVASPHSMWGHTAWAVAYWDRKMKESNV